VTRSRIAVVVSGFPRRSETFALNELIALAERGVLAGIFATKPGDPDGGQPGWERLQPHIELLPEGDEDRQGVSMAARLATRSITGIHAYFAHTPAAVAERAAASLGVPFGFSVHARDARKVASEELARRSRQAACVVACNRDVAGDIRRAGGRAHLVPHGVDLGRFAVMPQPPGPAMRVLAVGRLVAKKGFEVLIDALAALDEDVVLRVVGDGPLRPRLIERIRARGISHRVTLAGSLTHAELPAEFAAAHVVAVPSVVDTGGDRDGLPNVVLEAMASGRAVVGSDVGAITAAVRDGETGLVVSPGAVGQLADALRVLAARHGLRSRMGLRGRHHVERDYDLRACASCFVGLLEGAYA
jgi:glycosyltransferase involved in cell wall biosynthesis